MSDFQRLFFGVRLQQEVSENLWNQLSTLPPIHNLKTFRKIKVSWSRLENFHITLKFLGDTRSHLIPEILQAATPIAHSTFPFQVKLKGIGTFPNFRHPKILWLGVEDSSKRLHSIANSMNLALARLGFSVETRQFRPHLTLGRIREGKLQVSQWLPFAETEFNQSRIQDLVLFESTSTPSGTQYVEVAKIPFSPIPLITYKTSPFLIGTQKS